MRASLTMLLSNLAHTFRQSQGITVVATIELSHIFDVSDHGLVALLLLVESFSHIRKPLVHLRHTHPLHAQSTILFHTLCIWEKKIIAQIIKI